MRSSAVSTAATLSLRRLQARGFAVGNAIVHVSQRDLRQQGVFAEAPGSSKSNDGPFAAEMVFTSQAQSAVLAWEFGARGNAIARVEAADSIAHCNHPGAKFMAEQLDRRFRLKPPLDLLKGQRGDAKGQLRFGDAGLNAENLRQDMTCRSAQCCPLGSGRCNLRGARRSARAEEVAIRRREQPGEEAAQGRRPAQAADSVSVVLRTNAPQSLELAGYNPPIRRLHRLLV